MYENGPNRYDLRLRAAVFFWRLRPRHIRSAIGEQPIAYGLEGMRMASGFIGNEVPRKGLRVRVPCPPLKSHLGA